MSSAANPVPPGGEEVINPQDEEFYASYVSLVSSAPSLPYQPTSTSTAYLDSLSRDLPAYNYPDYVSEQADDQVGAMHPLCSPHWSSVYILLPPDQAD